MTHSNTNFSRGGQTYNAPSVEVLDLQVEGILCDSVKPSANPDDWTEGNKDWFE